MSEKADMIDFFKAKALLYAGNLYDNILLMCVVKENLINLTNGEKCNVDRR